MIDHIANIVKVLKNDLPKRSAKPVAGPDFLLTYNQEAAKVKETPLSKTHFVLIKLSCCCGI